jgi:hypothetical protein
LNCHYRESPFGRYWNVCQGRCKYLYFANIYKPFFAEHRKTSESSTNLQQSNCLNEALIIEDEVELSNSIVSYLKSESYACEVAHSYAAA